MLFAIVFPLLVLALTICAIYVQVQSSILSMPIATGTTVLTILLPLLATVNTFYTPVLSRILGSKGFRDLVVPALPIFQGVLTVVIAVLAFQGFLPAQSLDCHLEAAWQRLWRTHDGRAIERIQNTFDCCGFNSIVDRTWPRERCADIYGRHSWCSGPWRQSMQRTSGLEFAIAVIVGLMQLAQLFYMRRRGFRSVSLRDHERFAGRVSSVGGERLIENGHAPYRDAEDGAAEDEHDVPPEASDSAENGPRHRVEPSGLGNDEANRWRT